MLLLTTLVAQITVSTRLFIQFVFSTNMALLRITRLWISEKIHANMSLLNFLVFLLKILEKLLLLSTSSSNLWSWDKICVIGL